MRTATSLLLRWIVGGTRNQRGCTPTCLQMVPPERLIQKTSRCPFADEMSVSIFDEIADDLDQTGSGRIVERITVRGAVSAFYDRHRRRAGGTLSGLPRLLGLVEVRDDVAAVLPIDRQIFIGQSILLDHVFEQRVKARRTSIPRAACFVAVSIQQGKLKRYEGGKLTGLDAVAIDTSEP